MSGAPAPASIFAVELLGELIRRGVRDVVVCPGSRSQALALAAAAAERAGAIRLHVRVDERSAGFFALGVARETGIPAPVIVTSGTAVANLVPAAFEAHEGRVPFVVISADRPSELRGIRSNQATRQAGMFAQVARLAVDVPAPEFGAHGDLDRDFVVAPGVTSDPGDLAGAALSAALGREGAPAAGPVQLNLAFREPLSGTAGFDAMIVRGFEAAAQEAAQDQAQAADQNTSDGTAPVAGQARMGAQAAAPLNPGEVFLFHGDPLAVVIAGDSAGDEAAEFARAAGIPLLAEVVSGARFGREVITAYATLIDNPDIGGLIEQAIVFGHPTLTRQVSALLKRSDVNVIVVDPHAGTDHFTPTPDVRIVRRAIVAPNHDPAPLRKWLGTWVVADRALQRERTTVHEPDVEAARENGYQERSAYAQAELAAMREPVSREMLAESVWRATWPHDRLVLAASRLVRVLDALAPPRSVPVHANRGLAGIDGTVATALGIAVTSQSELDAARAAGVTRVLIGDLALLHDAGSLLLTEAEAQPRIQLFVGNDGGGTIFEGLEVAGSAAPADFARVMLTPQQVSLEQLAAAYGWGYRRVATRAELERLLTAPVAGPEIVEIPLDK